MRINYLIAIFFFSWWLNPNLLASELKPNPDFRLSDMLYFPADSTIKEIARSLEHYFSIKIIFSNKVLKSNTHSKPQEFVIPAGSSLGEALQKFQEKIGSVGLEIAQLPPHRHRIGSRGEYKEILEGWFRIKEKNEPLCSCQDGDYRK